MTSTTRSGRVYAATAEIDIKVSPHKRGRRNIVTPEKVESVLTSKILSQTIDKTPESVYGNELFPADKFDNDINHEHQQAELLSTPKDPPESVQHHEFTPDDLFDYEVGCEFAAAEPVMLASPVSTFKYDTSSDTESDISAGFGGWLTNTGRKETDEHNKENIPPVCQPMVVTSPNTTYQGVLSQPTIPRYPLAPRNAYGGVRDCLPPKQLERWLSSSLAPRPHTPGMSLGATSSVPQRIFTAEQKQRMEQNRLSALDKLRAKNIT